MMAYLALLRKAAISQENGPVQSFVGQATVNVDGCYLTLMLQGIRLAENVGTERARTAISFGTRHTIRLSQAALTSALSAQRSKRPTLRQTENLPPEE